MSPYRDPPPPASPLKRDSYRGVVILSAYAMASQVAAFCFLIDDHPDRAYPFIVLFGVMVFACRLQIQVMRFEDEAERLRVQANTLDQCTREVAVFPNVFDVPLEPRGCKRRGRGICHGGCRCYVPGTRGGPPA